MSPPPFSPLRDVCFVNMERLGLFSLKTKLLIVLFFYLINVVYGNLVHKKFQYKYSFKPPYLAQKDGSVPFWEYGGNAIASSENVRIAPSLRSQKGAIWTKQPINFDHWDIEMAFRVTGRGRIGADGLAFWYTQNKGSYDGDVFGSSDRWNGLGVFFDSFDNDNKHNNPYIMAVVNDGTKDFDHQNDGSTQQLAGCLRDFRNKPFPTKARIEYYQNTLTILFHNGMTANDQDYEMCFRAENVFLPKNGYFGVSAATGGLADDHDVIHFLTSSLHLPGQIEQPNQVPGEEQQKLTKEFEDYQRKLDQQKADYRKEHPEAPQKDAGEMEDWFESDNQRELRQIFEGQNHMYDVIKELNKKLDEVIGRQERTLSLVSQQGAGAMGQIQMPQQTGQVPPVAGAGDSIRRHEVEAIFNNQNLIVGLIKEVRQFIMEVKGKSDTIIINQSKQPTAQVQSVGYDTQAIIAELRDGMNNVKQNVAHVAQQVGGAGTGCPKPNCVSLTSLLVVVVGQLMVILGFNIWRNGRDSQSKKFY